MEVEKGDTPSTFVHDAEGDAWHKLGIEFTLNLIVSSASFRSHCRLLLRSNRCCRLKVSRQRTERVLIAR